MKQHLYIMGCNETGLVKIGIANDVTKRRRTLERAGGVHIRVIKTYGPYHQASALEASIHKMLDKCRMNGEWFKCTADEAVKAAEEAIAAFQDAKPERHEPDEEWLTRQAAAFLGCTRVEGVVINELFAMNKRLIHENNSLIDQLFEAIDLIDYYKGIADKSIVSEALKNKRALRRRQSEKRLNHAAIERLRALVQPDIFQLIEDFSPEQGLF